MTTTRTRYRDAYRCACPSGCLCVVRTPNTLCRMCVSDCLRSYGLGRWPIRFGEWLNDLVRRWRVRRFDLADYDAASWHEIGYAGKADEFAARFKPGERVEQV